MRLRYLGFIAFLLSASVAYGDGCYIPERAVRKIPEIVAQRAVLSWKDGVETLVISSALDSEAQTLGWIIPVPAIPTTMEKATPGALKTLDFCIQPKITHDLSQEIRATIWVVLLFNLFVSTQLFRQKWVHGLLVLLFVLLLLLPMLLSMAGVAPATLASTLHVETTATVGSYAISVLRPSRLDGLDGWLAENSFSTLPEAAGPIIAGYISQGWVFAAIKLTRSETGTNAPHPIKLVFASKEPVYPMKLTAVARGKPGFELFVIGDDRAACDMLQEEFCDRFSEAEKDEIDAGTQPRFRGSATRCGIGHLGLCDLMWDNCILTKFVGNVDAAGMTKDIQFAWKPFKAHQDHYFTQYGAGCVAVILFVIVVGGWNVVSMNDYARSPIRPKSLIRSFVKRLLLAIVCAAFVAGVCFALLPTLGNSDVHVSRGSGYSEFRFRREFAESLSQHPEVLRRNEPEIATFLLQELRNSAKNGNPKTNIMMNLSTGDERKVEDSPGNLTVEKQADKVIVRFYDRSGTAFVKTYPIGATGTPGQPAPVPAPDRGSEH